MFLACQKSKWAFAKGIDLNHKYYSASCVAICMHDMAALTENTWSYVEKHHNYLNELFRKGRGKADFWNCIPPHVITENNEELSFG